MISLGLINQGLINQTPTLHYIKFPLLLRERVRVRGRIIYLRYLRRLTYTALGSGLT
jgi:hypothetical protein